MTRLLFISDTHLGAGPMGDQQQKGYPEMLSAILSALQETLRTEGRIDFVLHGGDMIDSTTDANLAGAMVTFELSVPVYLCLGNHDVTALSLAPVLGFPGEYDTDKAFVQGRPVDRASVTGDP